MSGRFIAVVGPSGVGKDSLINALCAARPDLTRVRRVITRDPGLGGEDFDPVSADSFDALQAAGAFCLHWQAHGLSYGIPHSVVGMIAAGRDCIANLSRNMLPEAAALFPGFLALSVTANAETLARRLSARGREDRASIRARLDRQAGDLPPGLPMITVSNDGALDQAVQSALAALYPARG